MSLNKEQRERLRMGGAPRLIYPKDKPCPLEAGATLKVCAGMELVIERVKKTDKGDWLCEYMIRDFRVRLPRRNPPVDARNRDHLGADGYPKNLNQNAIKLASIEGAVTSAKALAVRGHDLAENLEDDEQRILNSTARDNRLAQLEDLLSAAESVEEALGERMGSRTVVNGEFERARAQIRRAKQKLRSQILALEREAA